MKKPERSRVIRLAEAQADIPGPPGEHFEDFTEDLAVWVVFYGPPGGEVPA
jgi:hypothetical protein